MDSCKGFMLMELARPWSDERAELFHYRTREKVEVDTVLDNGRGQVVTDLPKATTGPTAHSRRSG